MVSWYDVWCYTQWLGEFTDARSGKTYRFGLPNEAQWEYACRAGFEDAFTFTQGQDHLTKEGKECNFDGNYPYPENEKVEGGLYRRKTVPVDWTEFAANPWGFWQMHGNVWEWCFDWYDAEFCKPTEEIALDPVKEEGASARVLRGGSWGCDAGSCRSAYRDGYEPDYRFNDFGFRLAAVPVSLEPSKQGAKPA